jgi:flagellar basal body P-ring protein FlgI
MKGIDIMAEKKMTKAVAFAAAAEAMASVNPEVAEILAKEAERLSNRKTVARKPTATQVENEGIKAAILEAMEPGVKYTCGEVGKLVGVESSQKMSSILNAMVKAGALAKETGRKSLFSLPEVE